MSFQKVKIEVIVLLDSEEEYNPTELYQVAADMVEGEISGEWDIVSNETLTPQQMAEELEKQGSDPSFLLQGLPTYGITHISLGDIFDDQVFYDDEAAMKWLKEYVKEENADINEYAIKKHEEE